MQIIVARRCNLPGAGWRGRTAMASRVGRERSHPQHDRRGRAVVRAGHGVAAGGARGSVNRGCLDVMLSRDPRL